MAMIASGFSTGQSLVKILRLTSSFSVAASITRSQSPRSSSCQAGRDALERRLAVVFADRALLHLPGHVAVDGGEAGIDAVSQMSLSATSIAGERADLGDAAAHLSGADDADLSISMDIVPAWRCAVRLHSPSSTRADRLVGPSRERHSERAAVPAAVAAQLGQFLASSGRIWKRSPTRP